MARKLEFPTVDINDPDQLQNWYGVLYPRGSGPLSAMMMACALIEAIAEEKGITLILPTSKEDGTQDPN